MAYDQSAVRVQQLAGPGIEGLEHDPPVYHFDLEQPMMEQLLANPVEFLAGIGLGPEQGVALGGTMEVRLTGDQWAWEGNRWLTREEVGDGGVGDGGTPSTSSCCYISGPSEMT